MRAGPILVVLLLAGCVGPGSESGLDRPPLVVATTTSAYDTGLLDFLKPLYEENHSVNLRFVSVGTGQALRLGESGDADVVLVHARAKEEAFVAAGHGLWRRPVMFNHFVLAGPREDPAGLGASNVTEAFTSLARGDHAFASRGDQSGTHLRELELWSLVSADPGSFGRSWYLETGTGMAETLLVANERRAYVLTDDATFLKLEAAGRIPRLAALVTNEPPLRNQYAVLPVSNATHPGVRTDLATAFAEWLTGPEGQAAIARHRTAGVALFTANAGDPYA